MLTEHFPFNYQLRLLINTHYLNILVYEIVEFQNLINIVSKAVREMVRSVSFPQTACEGPVNPLLPFPEQYFINSRKAPVVFFLFRHFFFFLSIFTYWLTCHHSGIDNRESYLITEKLACPVLNGFRLIYISQRNDLSI